MPRDGTITRQRILDETTKLVLTNGFAGTSIDQILEKTQLTKGSFFYHFKNKADLAGKLMDHWVENDMKELEATLEETSHLDSIPRERLLAFVQRFIDILQELQAPYPGCLYASYIYEPENIEADVWIPIKEAVLRWRNSLSELIDETVKINPPRIPINSASLADLFTVIFEGAIITSKALGDPKITAEQLKHYRTYLELIFPEQSVQSEVAD